MQPSATSYQKSKKAKSKNEQTIIPPPDIGDCLAKSHSETIRALVARFFVPKRKSGFGMTPSKSLAQKGCTDVWGVSNPTRLGVMRVTDKAATLM
jgi:hypothetical protein